MAKATKKILRIDRSEEEQRKNGLESIETALLENKEAIQETLKIMKNMHERGILDLSSSLFGQGDKVLEILVKTVDTPEMTNTLKNLLLMLGTLGTLNVQQLEPLIFKVNAGIERTAEIEKSGKNPSYFALLRSLNDPKVKRTMTLMVSFLKGMGEDQEDSERTTPEKQQRTKNESGETYEVEADVKSKPNSQEKDISDTLSKQEIGQRNSNKNGWLTAAAGISLLVIPLSLVLRKQEDKNNN